VYYGAPEVFVESYVPVGQVSSDKTEMGVFYGIHRFDVSLNPFSFPFKLFVIRPKTVQVTLYPMNITATNTCVVAIRHISLWVIRETDPGYPRGSLPKVNSWSVFTIVEGEIHAHRSSFEYKAILEHLERL
jgi:hypothetical protein